MHGRDWDQLLLAARAGGEWAWARIYDDLSPSVLGYLRARGAADPEDLLGETFLQVVRDLHTFDGDERRFRSWVFTVAHHRLLDDARKRARRPAIPVPVDEMDEATLGEGDTEQEALDRLGARRVRELLASLSPDQQDVLLLRVIADLGVEDIARIVGKRPGAVKALQRRGLAKLRRESSVRGVPG